MQSTSSRRISSMGSLHIATLLRARAPSQLGSTCPYAQPDEPPGCRIPLRIFGVECEPDWHELRPGNVIDDSRVRPNLGPYREGQAEHTPRVETRLNPLPLDQVAEETAKRVHALGFPDCAQRLTPARTVSVDAGP